MDSPPSRLIYVESRIDGAAFARAERDASVIVLTDASLSQLRAEDLIGRRAFVLGVARNASSAALYCDFLALGEDATIDLSAFSFSDFVAAAIWRTGPRARRLLLRHEIAAREAFEIGLCDALLPAGSDSLKWAEGWLGTRSVVALQSAAALIRRNRNELVERAEFARLFATGEPQRGLAMFLDKLPLDFSGGVTVERI